MNNYLTIRLICVSGSHKRDIRKNNLEHLMRNMVGITIWRLFDCKKQLFLWNIYLSALERKGGHSLKGGKQREWLSKRYVVLPPFHNKKETINLGKCLLADRNSLPIRDYWQTVQKIFMSTSALPQSFEQCSNSCSFVQSIRGLPTRRNWQNVYIFCERSANNL